MQKVICRSPPPEKGTPFALRLPPASMGFDDIYFDWSSGADADESTSEPASESTMREGDTANLTLTFPEERRELKLQGVLTPIDRVGCLVGAAQRDGGGTPTKTFAVRGTHAFMLTAYEEHPQRGQEVEENIVNLLKESARADAATAGAPRIALNEVTPTTIEPFYESTDEYDEVGDKEAADAILEKVLVS